MVKTKMKEKKSKKGKKKILVDPVVLQEIKVGPEVLRR